MTVPLEKDERVFYRGKPGTVQRSVGGDDYVIKMDEGKRFVVGRKKLVPFEMVIDKDDVDEEVILPEPSNEEELTPEEQTRLEKEAEALPEDFETEEELRQATEEAAAPPRPMLARKKFFAMTKKELYNLAQLYVVPGRSGMDIDQLRTSVAEHLELTG